MITYYELFFIIIYSQILPSPTTGAFPGKALNLRENSSNSTQEVKQENRPSSDFSFHGNTRPQIYQVITSFT
jgi:hypothetical protein